MSEVMNEEKLQKEIKNGGVSEEEEADESSLSQRRSRHSKKHRHKHNKKHKHKHKKRKNKRKSSSRSRSRSSSRSRSKSPDKTANTDDESIDPSCLEAYDVASFKLEKSLSRSPSPKDKDNSENNNDKMPEVASKQTQKPKKDGSESPPFYTEQDLLERDGVLPIAKSPPATDCALADANTKMTLESGSESNKASVNTETTENLENPQSNSQNVSHSLTALADKYRKSKSKSPLNPKKRSQSRSLSRSVSPKSKKIKSASHSKSRSRSPKSKISRKSRSRSSSRERKKPRKKSRSRSVSSKSRSRSPRRKRQSSKDRRSGSRSRKRSRDRRSKSRDRRRSRSRDRRSRSPQRGSHRSYRSSPPRKGRRNSSYDRRSSRRQSNYRRSRSASPRKRSSRRSRSAQRRYRDRSRSSTRRGYRNRSRSKSRSRRSRSRSYSSRRRRSRTRSRSKSRDRSKRRSKSKSADSNNDNKNNPKTAENETPSSTNTTTAKDLVGKAPTVTDPSNKKSLAMLTEFCKKLTEARGIPENDGKEEDDETKEDEEEEEGVISHPFLVAPKRDITIPQVIFPVKPMLPPVNMIDTSKPLMEQFPVSCGTKHHEKETEDSSIAVTIPDVNGSAAVQPQQTVFHQPQIQEKLDISSLVVKRMDAQRRLQANANDVDAMLALQEIEMKLNNWCQSNVKPGQFTGQLAKQMMPKQKMNAGYQAWAKKDMFQNLNPVSGGVGMRLLQKMGWAPGQVLGKSGKGMVEPIALQVKVDRKGLSSTMERPLGKKGGPVQKLNAKTPMDLQGKHPISLLQEYCARRKWNIPEFTLIFDEGPPHSKQFLFKVLVNGYEYQNPVVSGNKKHAKAQAAVAALKGLGLVPEDAEF